MNKSDDINTKEKAIFTLWFTYVLYSLFYSFAAGVLAYGLLWAYWAIFQPGTVSDLVALSGDILALVSFAMIQYFAFRNALTKKYKKLEICIK